MLQPKNLLMKRGTLLGKEPREGRKVFAIIDFLDFAFGISIIFLVLPRYRFGFRNGFFMPIEFVDYRPIANS